MDRKGKMYQFRIKKFKISSSQIELFRFLLVGGLNTIVGVSVIFFLKWMFGLGDIISNMLGYTCGLIVSYIGNATITFRTRVSDARNGIKFILVFFVAYSANLITVLFLANCLNVNSYIAQLCGIFVYTPTFFIGSKYYAFRD